MSDEGGIVREGSPVAEKIERLLALIVHMDSCIRHGGPSNYAQFLDPYDKSLLDEAIAAHTGRPS
jgi:hypothetical protein